MKKTELIDLIKQIIKEVNTEKSFVDLKESVKRDLGPDMHKFINNLKELMTKSRLPYEVIQGIMWSTMFSYSKSYFNGEFDK